MSNISIIRDENYSKYFIINSDDIIQYGYDEALILGNIDRCYGLNIEQIYKIFPHISKEKINKIFNENEENEIKIILDKNSFIKLVEASND